MNTRDACNHAARSRAMVAGLLLVVALTLGLAAVATRLAEPTPDRTALAYRGAVFH